MNRWATGIFLDVQDCAHGKTHGTAAFGAKGTLLGVAVGSTLKGLHSLPPISHLPHVTKHC